MLAHRGTDQRQGYNRLAEVRFPHQFVVRNDDTYIQRPANGKGFMQRIHTAFRLVAHVRRVHGAGARQRTAHLDDFRSRC